MSFLGTALTIVTSSFALAGVTWTLASTDDGRIKALLWWCIGITAAGGYVVFEMKKREFREVRYARALESAHKSHHLLRDASYERYIAHGSQAAWKPIVEESLRAFSESFSIATGAPCHATIKIVADPSGGAAASQSVNDYIVETFARSSPRQHVQRGGVPANTVGRNTDFRALFSPDADNRCWYHNDLLQLDDAVYDNPHWPERPSVRNVPYRSTMVWPIRKVLRQSSPTTPQELYLRGFLTVDSKEPNILDYDRHFDLGAAYADNLVPVLWDPKELKRLNDELNRKK